MRHGWQTWRGCFRAKLPRCESLSQKGLVQGSYSSKELGKASGAPAFAAIPGQFGFGARRLEAHREKECEEGEERGGRSPADAPGSASLSLSINRGGALKSLDEKRWMSSRTWY